MESNELLNVLLPAAERVDRLIARLPKFLGLQLGYSDSLEVVPPNDVAERAEIKSECDAFLIKFSNLLGLGFGDGRMLEGFVKSWGEARGWSGAVGSAEDRYLDPIYLLYKACAGYLLKREEVDALRYYDREVRPLLLQSEYGGGFLDKRRKVMVSVSELADLADELFPFRSAAWLKLFNEVDLTWTGPRSSLGSESTQSVCAAEMSPGRRSIATAVADEFEAARMQMGEIGWELFCSIAERGSDEYRDSGRFTRAAYACAGALAL